MHTSRDDLEAMVMGEYEGRQIDAGAMRIAFESMPAQLPPDESELIEISPVAEYDRTMATIARNIGLVTS